MPPALKMNDSWNFCWERAFRFRSLGHQFTVAVAVKLFRFLDILNHMLLRISTIISGYIYPAEDDQANTSAHSNDTIPRPNTTHTPWDRDNSLRWWFIIGRKSVHTIRGISPHLHTLGWQYPDGFDVVYESPPKWGRWVIPSGMLVQKFQFGFVVLRIILKFVFITWLILWAS